VTVPGGPLVVAGVSGSPGSVHALRYAADLARRHGAALVPVLAWVPPGGMAEHKYPDPELRRQCKQDAWQRLRGAIGTAFGGFPHGVRTWPLVLRGEAGPELVSLASQPGDLLVIGGGRRTALTRLVCCPVARHCLAHAHCPVLAVPPPRPDPARRPRPARLGIPPPRPRPPPSQPAQLDALTPAPKHRKRGHVALEPAA
jgi:nucleotide-binding universal stress UspA family protein